MVNSELLETVGSRDGGVREHQQGQDGIRQIRGQKVHKQILKGLHVLFSVKAFRNSSSQKKSASREPEQVRYLVFFYKLTC